MYTVANTITAPNDDLLQPSEQVAPAHDTNTYYSTVPLRRTIHGENGATTLIDTSDVLTRIIVTESLAAPQPQPTALNIFATKTYLTTFTYFTTIAAQRPPSSTIVDSHTRVIENVITERIPIDMLPAAAIVDIRASLADGGHHGDLVTVATLIGGQALEITANMRPFDGDRSTVAPHLTDDNDNDDDDSAAATNQLNDRYDDADDIANDIDDDEPLPQTVAAYHVVKHTAENAAAAMTAVTPSPIVSLPLTTTMADGKLPAAAAPATVGNLMGSFNLNGLTAFGPVFNAMAGLIQNNLAISRQQQRHSIVGGRPNNYTTATKEPLATQLDVTTTTAAIPMYIPVGGIADEGIEIAESQNVERANFNAFAPPPPENNKNYERVLLNNGIPISPGEIITASSDVIIGRPSGIGPRLPPFSSGKGKQRVVAAHDTNYAAADSMAISSLQSETYIGPPPPLRHPSPPHRRPNIIPIRHDQDKYANKYYAQPPPPPHQSKVATSAKDYYASLLTNKLPPPPLPPKPDAQPTTVSTPAHKEDIIEIQLIPEVYSTDLPPMYVADYQHSPLPQQPLPPSGGGHQWPRPQTATAVTPTTADREVVEQSTGRPLLVDIQPSQIANVIIPHGSTTALIYGGTNEPHKNGQYFDEPAPYKDHEFSIGFSAVAGTALVDNTVDGRPVRVQQQQPPQQQPQPQPPPPQPQPPQTDRKTPEIQYNFQHHHIYHPIVYDGSAGTKQQKWLANGYHGYQPDDVNSIRTNVPFGPAAPVYAPIGDANRTLYWQQPPPIPPKKQQPYAVFGKPAANGYRKQVAATIYAGGDNNNGDAVNAAGNHFGGGKQTVSARFADFSDLLIC